MLLSQLLKYTPEDHKDYEALSKAFKAVESIVLSVNENKRIKDNQHKIREIEERIGEVEIVDSCGPNFALGSEIDIRFNKMVTP